MEVRAIVVVMVVGVVGVVVARRRCETRARSGEGAGGVPLAVAVVVAVAVAVMVIARSGVERSGVERSGGSGGGLIGRGATLRELESPETEGETFALGEGAQRKGLVAKVRFGDGQERGAVEPFQRPDDFRGEPGRGRPRDHFARAPICRRRRCHDYAPTLAANSRVDQHATDSSDLTDTKRRIPSPSGALRISH